jgi:potassium-dependent mechanosensitive channel
MACIYPRSYLRLGVSRALVLLVLLLAIASLAHSQPFSSLLPQTSAPEAPAPPERSIEERLVEAEARIAALDATIAQAAAGVTEEQSLQLSVPLSELETRVGVLTDTRENVSRLVYTLQEHQETRRSIQELGDEIEAFQGLPEPPPYTVLFVDALRAAVRTRALNLEAAGKDTEYSAQSLDTQRQALEKARRELRSMQDAATANTASGVDFALQWKLTQKRDEVALFEARMRLREAMVSMQRDVVTLRELQLELDQKRLAIAAANIDTDPESLQRQMEEHQAKAESARARYEKALDAARKAQDDAEKALAAVRAQIAAATPEEAPGLNALLETRRVQAETARRIVDAQFNILASVDTEKVIIEQRYAILGLRSFEEKNEIRADLQRRADIFAQVGGAIEGRIASLRPQISSLQTELDAWKPEQGNRAVAEERLASLRTREAVYAEGLFRIVELQQLLTLALEDTERLLKKVPLTAYLSSIWRVTTEVWDFEFTTYGEEPNLKRITLGKVFITMLLVLAGFVAATLAARLVRKITSSRFRVEENVSFIVQKFTFYIVLIIAFIYTLEYVDIPLTVFGFLGGALAIGVGFGAQNLINNFISGIIIFMEKPVKLGDMVEVDGQRGTILDIGSRASRLRLFSGVDIIVPNSTFLETNVVNWTLTDQQIRFSVQVGVAYGSNTRDVSKLMRRAVDEHQRVLKDPKPVVLFQEFGDNSLVFEVFFWLNLTSNMDARVVCSDLRFIIDNLFRDAGISIAYPQRDLHIDTLRPIDVRLAPPEPPKPTEGDKDTGTKPRLPS